jgi:hypothetical protein
MISDHTIRNTIGKTIAVVIVIYVGICGLPGLADKNEVQMSQQKPTAEQQIRVAYELFEQSMAEAGGPELMEKKTLNWKKTVKKGETPVDSEIDGAYVEDGEVKEEHHPLPDLSGYEKTKKLSYDTLDDVPGKETYIVKYQDKDDADHQIWIGLYGDKIACYFHSNPGGDENWGGRATYQPDRNFEQKQATEWPDFWHNLGAFFPEHYD